MNQKSEVVFRRKLPRPISQRHSSSVPLRPWGDHREEVNGAELKAEGYQSSAWMLFPGTWTAWEENRPKNPGSLSMAPFRLPEQAESESTTTYFGATGDLVPWNHLYMRKQRPRKVKHVPQAPPRVRVFQLLLRCWLLPPGTQQCGYFQYKWYCRRTFFESLKSPFLLCSMTWISKVHWSPCPWCIRNKGTRHVINSPTSPIGLKSFVQASIVVSVVKSRVVLLATHIQKDAQCEAQQVSEFKVWLYSSKQ